MANPLHFDALPPLRPECQHCQELLADAADASLRGDGPDASGLLSSDDQARFDAHIASCDDCSAAFADAVRGAAWLQFIKSPRPEPSAYLLDRILAATSERDTRDFAADTAPAFQPLFEPALSIPNAAVLEPVRPAANILPFRPRVPYLSRAPRFLFEPRLAMTAAMAFFSIALTLSLTGVRLSHLAQLHPADLNPSSLRRSWFETTAAVARRTESLRVVHVVEARVADLRDNRDDETAAPLGAAPRHPSAPPAEHKAPAPPRPVPPDPNGISRRTLGVPRALPVSLRTRTPFRTRGLA